MGSRSGATSSSGFDFGVAPKSSAGWLVTSIDFGPEELLRRCILTNATINSIAISNPARPNERPSAKGIVLSLPVGLIGELVGISATGVVVTG